MAVHERLNLDHWLHEFPLQRFIDEQKAWCQKYERPFSDNWLPEVSVISSPIHLAVVEQIRSSIFDRGHDLGPSSPADLFLWRICEYSEGPITRIGGKAFRDRSTPWPTTNNGRPLSFLAQISFLDSKDLVPHDMPGEVLSMYGTWTGSGYVDMESLVFEWASLEGGQSQSNHDVPEWKFCAEGVIHRTVCYPECDESVHSTGIDVPDLFQATQISTHPFRIQGEGLDEALVFASLSSFQPNQDWPFINFPRLPHYTHPKGHVNYLSSIFELMMGDTGSINFYKDKSGKFTQSWDCY